ncbi:MAG: HPF/RaiA family ribosome-associated protein, partial [Bdellovibrionota bacterium]
RNNNHVHVEESSDDMYKSIDAAFQDLKRVLTREKEKQVDHHVKADPFVATALAAAAVTYGIEEADAIDAEDVIHEHQATGH